MMKRSTLIFFLIFLLAIGFTLNAYAEIKPIRWIVQSCFPLETPASKYGISMWANKVEAMSGGRLIIRLHAAGEIVPATGVFEAVRDGVLDAGLNTPAFQRGLYPAGDLFYTLPAGITKFEDLIVWMYGGEGLKLNQDMYGDKIIVFVLGLTPPEEIWSKKPINSLDDLRGLKIRTAGLGMNLFEALGSSVVMIPGSEVVPALQRGVIDAAEVSDPAGDYGLGLADVSDYLVGPPIHMGPNIYQLVINPKSWEELPGDLQEIVKNAATAATLEGYGLYWMEVVHNFQKIMDSGVTITRFSPEAQAKARELTFEILDRKSKEDPYFGKVWDSQKNFLENFKPYYNFTSFD